MEMRGKGGAITNQFGSVIPYKKRFGAKEIHGKLAPICYQRLYAYFCC
jgi:hypothetical protein